MTRLTVLSLLLGLCAPALAQDGGEGETTLRSMGGAPPRRPEPSPVIFPLQRMPLRFSHKTHVRGEGMRCTTCHREATSSMWSSHNLLPPERVCAGCHPIDHELPTQTTDPPSRCDFCHEGWQPERPRRVEIVQVPRPNVRFPHALHVVRQSVPCERCHGDVAAQDLATRANLPTMQSCFACHNGNRASQECDGCHLTQRDGRLVTHFPEGTLTPPRWMRGSEHGPDWVLRHRRVAGDDSPFCGTCHAEQFCLDCHDGRVRNREVHPNDWLTLHPVSARRDDPGCSACHRRQTFCIDCHRRTGVALSDHRSPLSAASSFHPDAWMQSGSQHHRFDARRSLPSCVSCHAENDCVSCHGALGVGAGGADSFSNPTFHEAGFAGSPRCRSLRRRNSRPCLRCHRPDDPNFTSCDPG